MSQSDATLGIITNIIRERWCVRQRKGNILWVSEEIVPSQCENYGKRVVGFMIAAIQDGVERTKLARKGKAKNKRGTRASQRPAVSATMVTRARAAKLALQRSRKERAESRGLTPTAEPVGASSSELPQGRTRKSDSESESPTHELVQVGETASPIAGARQKDEPLVVVDLGPRDCAVEQDPISDGAHLRTPTLGEGNPNTSTIFEVS